jgi:hypothetical protein
MSEGTRELIRRLQQSFNDTFDRLLALEARDLDHACTHPCGHGPAGSTSIWHLLANDIDHDRMHAAGILNARHDLRLMQTQPERLLAEWMAARGALAGALIGLPDDALDLRLKEGEWSFREMVEHVLFWEDDSIAAGLQDLRTGEPWRADPALQFGGPVPVPRAAASGSARTAESELRP